MVVKHQPGLHEPRTASETSGPVPTSLEGGGPADTLSGVLTLRPPMTIAAGQGAPPASPKLVVRVRQDLEALFAALLSADAAAATAGRSRELALRAQRGNPC